jgi:hypothetical protein
LCGRGIKPEQATDRIIQLFVLKREWKFVDGMVDVAYFDDGMKRDITKEGQLLANFQNEGFFCSA